MIEPTDEMLAAFAESMREPMPVRERPARIRDGLAAVLAIVERQHQAALADAYQRGRLKGQHRLCPRCGVELEREVAEELAERDAAP